MQHMRWLQVTVIHGKMPSDATKGPFETAYTAKPSSAQPASGSTLSGSMLLLRMPWTASSWAVIVNPDGPAEW
jgi:hypothetical protein